MKTTKTLYWTTTSLVSLAFLMGAVQELLHAPGMIAAMQQLGYPEYLLNILGTAKVLGVVALLIPVFPRLKEWAYAGLV